MPKSRDFIVIDCMPSLGIVTVNALTAADRVLIPVQAAYLPVKGLQQLIKTIGMIKRSLNLELEIEGILLTMVDARTNYARDIMTQVHEVYGKTVPVFEIEIPLSVRAAETSAVAQSIYEYDPKGESGIRLLRSDEGGACKWLRDLKSRSTRWMSSLVFLHLWKEAPW